MKHVVKDNLRRHVLYWDKRGVHCSEKHCEINKLNRKVVKGRKACARKTVTVSKGAKMNEKSTIEKLKERLSSMMSSEELSMWIEVLEIDFKLQYDMGVNKGMEDILKIFKPEQEAKK